MATVKFKIRSKSGNAQIYIRLTLGHRKEFQTTTGLVVDAKAWSTEKSMPKQNNPENKQLTSQLRDLSNYILTQYNTEYTGGVVFSTDWLRRQIDGFFGRFDEKVDDNILTNYMEIFNRLRELDNRTKKTTDQKYVLLKDKIEKFQKFKRRIYVIAEIDRIVLLEFRKWLGNEGKLMDNTAQRTLRNLKTVLLDARDNGKIIHHQVNSFKIDKVESIKVFLSFEEIEKIKNTLIIGDDLIHTRDWLIIGCNTGQRVGDLLGMTKRRIYTKIDADGHSYRFIDLVQGKGKKQVSIPINNEVEQILIKYNGDFPPIFGKTKDSGHTIFNRHLKKVCELAEISERVKGKVYDDELERNVLQDTEKHHLVSSHICRRSFATNYYGDRRFPTPRLMAITGHATESVFLSYIGKTSTDHAMETAKTFREIAKEKERVSS